MEDMWVGLAPLPPGEKPPFNPRCYKQLGYPYVKTIFADVTGQTNDMILWCEVSCMSGSWLLTLLALQVCWICIVIDGQRQSPHTAWEKHINDKKHRIKLEWRDRISRKLCACDVAYL